MSDRRDSWDSDRDLWQAILNAQPIPPRRSQIDHDVAVTARIVWERDGEEWIDTRTIAYTRDGVLVQLHDKRLARVVAVWVASTDVRRR